VKRTIPIIGIILILILSGLPTILSFDNCFVNQVEDDNNVDWWPMFHHDLQNTGYSNSTAPNTNNTLWDINLPKNDSGNTNNPIVYNGKLYFTSTTNRVYCLDSSNGEMIWIKKLGNKEYYPGTRIPTIYDNKLFVSGYDGKIYCLNASNGGIIWTSIPIHSAVFALKVAYDRVYVGANDYPHRFYCLNASDGEVIWSWVLVLEPPSSPAIFDEKVYVCNAGGIVYCLDAFSGEKIWSHDTGGDTFPDASSPVIYNNKAYVIDEESYWGGYINCLDAYNGTLLWRTQIAAGGMGHFSPTIAYGKVYIGSSLNRIICLNAETGSFIWYKEFGGLLGYSSPAIADGKLYFGTDIYSGTNQRIVCINADNGSFIWSYKIGIYMDDIPAIADGKLYCSGGKKIYCFGDDIPPDVKIVSPKKDTLYFLGRNISFISSVIIGSINIEINAYDNESGLDFVKLYIDDVEKKNFSADDSFVWSWDERTFEKHIIKVIACDKIGNIAEYSMTVWKFF